MGHGSGRFEQYSQECDCVVFLLVSVFLTDIEDEGVAESIVPVVAAVDQELCVREDGAAVPAVAQRYKLYMNSIEHL